MTNLTHYYAYFEQGDDYQETLWLLTLLSFEMLLVILNVGSILVILTSPILRCTPKYVLAINLSIVFLVQALLLLSVWIAARFYSQIQIDFCTLYYYQFLVGILCVALIGTFCAAMNIVYVIRIKSPNSFDSNKQYFVLAIFIILAYFVNGVTVTPIYNKFVDRVEYIMDSQSVCGYKILNARREIILLVLANVPHYCFVILAGCLILILYYRYKNCRRISKPYDLVVTNIVVLILCFIPVLIKLWCLSHLRMNAMCKDEGIWQRVQSVAPLTVGILVPFIWFLNPVYRHAVRDFITCKCCKASLTNSYELV
ncbi:uncharacterized protein LOC126817482 [Patella vulgata]|uniref:uncharacterized protein LOC126817482 n=1 Tax=Patella vulgata TaxID=6465 RepID=UPI002180773F|nr:uncharacterized protein LOC126817482 [Patella vulgata]